MTAKGPSLEEQIEALEYAAEWYEGQAPHGPLKAAAATLRSLAAREQERSQSDAEHDRKFDENIAAIDASLERMQASSPAQAGVDDWQWLHRFINCTPFGEHAPLSDLKRAHDIVQRARDEIAKATANHDAWQDTVVEKNKRIAALEKDLAAARDTIRSMKKQFQMARERP